MPGPISSSPPPAARDVRSLSGLVPFLRPYRGRIALAVLFLVLAAASTLVFPVALRGLIDQGFAGSDPGTRVIVLPTVFIGRRVRRLSRASQDRVADSSAIAAEVLNAVPVVQSYLQEDREAVRFGESTERAFSTAIRRTTLRSFMVAFIIGATF